MTTTHIPRRGRVQRHVPVRTLLGAVALAASVAACKQSELDVPSPNSATVTGATSDPTALQLLFTGLFSGVRGTRTNMISESMVFGREGYSISPQDGRSVTVPLIVTVINGVKNIDPTLGF